METDALN